MAVHSIQNRTGEFQAILATAKRRQASAKGVSASSQRRSLLTDEQKKAAGHGGGASNGSANGGGDDAPRRSEFARRAAEIGRGIGATMAKLERLAQLAKKKTMFDDNPVQVNELTFVVKQDLSSLNQQIGALQALTRQEHPGARAGADQEGEHNRNVLVLLQGRLSSVGADFKDILEVRTRNMAASRSRTEHFVSAVGQPAAAAAAAAATATGPGAGAAAAAAAALQHSASPLYGTPSRGTPSPGADLLSLQPSGDHQVLMMMEEAQPTNTYIQQRGQAIEAIESTITELGSIFSQLATMVSEQSDMIERIDANTEDIVDNVSGAQRELLKYWGRVSSNRWLIAKMFGVLMIFFLFWVLIAG